MTQLVESTDYINTSTYHQEVRVSSLNVLFDVKSAIVTFVLHCNGMEMMRIKLRKVRHSVQKVTTGCRSNAL
jgi:hypothetical protein